MRCIFVSSLLLLLTLGLSVTEANAGRFSGGRAFHSVHSNPIFSRTSYARRPHHATMASQTPHHKWRSGLTGFLIGGVLASLFMGHGFGSALFSWIALGMVAYLIANLLQRRKQLRSSPINRT